MEGIFLIFILFIIFYFAVLIFVGVIAHKKTSKNPQDYFLANRNFGTIILFFTLIATNFSAFTFLGFAGNAYKTGFGQFGIMGFGTAFMAITFFLIGRKVWKLGKEKKYITPPELIGDRFNSKTLRILFMIVMVVFTIPYLAVQAIGAGIIIENVTSNISMQTGAIFTILIISVYVLIGGMRASGWTDFFQGIIMIISLLIAIVFISINLGGFENANLMAHSANPDLFTRPGLNEYFTPGIWFSFMILWVFADPMFPQIFSRFYTAKNQDSIKKSMILYPIVVTFLFLFPVLIGVWAHGVGLIVPSDQADSVLPLMVEKFTPYVVYVFVMIGALAALMSTADSQLLSLSTMISHDTGIKRIFKNEVSLAKIIIFLLALVTIIFVIGGYDASSGIMGTLVKTTFSGLSVLFPTTIAALYWSRATKNGCIASIILGEVSVALFYFEILPSFGLLSAIWSVLIASIVLIVISLIDRSNNYSQII